MQYDFSLAGGATQVMNIRGRFFKYKAGAGPIRVRASAGGYVDLLPGQGVWNVDYDSLTVQDKSGAANTGVLLAGDFDFHDDRITGTVDVVDGGRTRTFNNTAFCLGTGTNGAAGQYPYVSLWNPAGSGKNVIVEAIIASSGGAGGWSLSGINTDFVTGSQPGRSKKPGGAASSGYVKITSDPGILGIPYFTLDLAAATPFVYLPKEPFLLTPGNGIAAHGTVLAGNFNCAFEWFEELI